MSDRELDAKMAELMGWRLLAGDTWIDEKNAVAHPNFRPSKSIAAADLVIDKMEEMGFSFHLRSVVPSSDPPVYIAHFGDRRKKVTEFTRPLAICHAARAALMAAEAE